MIATRTPAQEAAEDIFFGQVVIIVARWFLIATGALLSLWSATQPAQLIAGLLPIVALMGMNFYLHGRYLMERPGNRALITVASLLDLLLVTAIVLVGPGGGGLASHYFVLYYPAVLAFAFVFPPRTTVAYASLAMAAYVLASFIPGGGLGWSSHDVEALVQRLTVFGTVAFLGTFYWRIQRERRRAATAARGMIPRLGSILEESGVGARR